MISYGRFEFGLYVANKTTEAAAELGLSMTNGDGYDERDRDRVTISLTSVAKPPGTVLLRSNMTVETGRWSFIIVRDRYCWKFTLLSVRVLILCDYHCMVQHSLWG